MHIDRSGRLTTKSLMIMILLVAISLNASANPMGTESWYDDFNMMFISIFLLNLPVDFSWFCAALLAIFYFSRENVGELPRRSTAFLSAVIGVALIVATLGVLIDFTLLLARYPLGYVFYYDIINWTAAAGLIFASIYLSSSLLLRIDWKLNIVPAAAMAVGNLIWWQVAVSAGPFFASLMTPLCIMLAPVLLVALWRLHAHIFTEAGKTEYSPWPD